MIKNSDFFFVVNYLSKLSEKLFHSVVLEAQKLSFNIKSNSFLSLNFIMYTFPAAAYGELCDNDHKKNGKFIWQEDLKSCSNYLKFVIFFKNDINLIKWYTCVKKHATCIIWAPNFSFSLCYSIEEMKQINERYVNALIYSLSFIQYPKIHSVHLFIDFPSFLSR